MALKVQPVLLAKGSEVLLAESSAEVTLHLVAELAGPVIDQAVIVLLVALHVG